jgi:NTE family protein
MQASWWQTLRRGRGRLKAAQEPLSPAAPRIGIALGGGFARGIAHIGVLRVMERHQIPIHAISGVSAGSMVAAAYAAGADTAMIERVARGMRFRDVARWTISLMGLAGSDRMIPFLGRMLKCSRFEEMNIRLAVVAADLVTGKPVVFSGEGDVVLPIRASCSYPGLFQPVRYNGYCLVDGYVAAEVPTAALIGLGATKIIAVHLPGPSGGVDPHNVFGVIHRCLQVMGHRLDHEWRAQADLVISPAVEDVPWDGFQSTGELIERGEQAAMEALPAIEAWLGRRAGTARRGTHRMSDRFD